MASRRRRLLVGPFASDVRWAGGATAPLDAGADAARCVGVARDGSPTGAFFFVSAESRSTRAIEARDAAIEALLAAGSRSDPGARADDTSLDGLLGTAPSGRTAGIRVVESMRVGGTSSPSSASE